MITQSPQYALYYKLQKHHSRCQTSHLVYNSLSLIGTLPDVSITGTTSTDTSIKVNIGTGRVIIGYHRLDLGVSVGGEYENNRELSSRTFSSLVPGAKYRITAWELGGGDNRRRNQSPAVREVTTMEQCELMQWSVNWSHKQCAHITN